MDKIETLNQLRSSLNDAVNDDQNELAASLRAQIVDIEAELHAKIEE